MEKFYKQYVKLLNDITKNVLKLINKHGVETGCTYSTGLEVPRDFHYTIDGYRITHITEYLLVANGNHYSHGSMSVDELVCLIDDMNLYLKTKKKKLYESNV